MKNIEADKLIERFKKTYDVINMDRDEFWSIFMTRILSEAKQDTNGVYQCSSDIITGHIWSAIMTGYLKPKEEKEVKFDVQKFDIKWNNKMFVL